jgi:long-subunit acyl-CoA synthetase (AMP-forming)
VGVQSVGLAEVCAVLYTSGSTGVPKGVVFTEELCMPRYVAAFHHAQSRVNSLDRSEGVAQVQPFIRLDFQSFDPSFLLSVLQSMLCGGQRIFASSLATLMDDFRIGRPTHIGTFTFVDHDIRVADVPARRDAGPVELAV